MKKTTVGLTIICFFSVLLLSGCLPKKQADSPQSSTGSSGEKSGGLLESIKDAFLNSVGFKCEYETAGDQGKMTYYAKEGKIRIDGAWKDKDETATIILEDKIYNWNKVTKEGLVLPINNSEEDGTQVQKPEDIIEELENNKQYCRQADVPDSLFVPPTDVSFQDLGSIFEKMRGGEESLPEIPTIRPTEAEEE